MTQRLSAPKMELAYRVQMPVEFVAFNFEEIIFENYEFVFLLTADEYISRADWTVQPW